MQTLSSMGTGPLSARGATGRSGGTFGFGNATPRSKNPLLVKDDVGKAKPSCYDLPEGSTSYGRPGNLDLEGAREVSMQWVSHVPSREPVEASPDFVRLHRKATAQKVTTSKDLKHFRNEHEGHSKTPRSSSTSQPPKPMVPSDVIPGFTYGRKVRPSTPINEVISYRFGEKAEQEAMRTTEQFFEQKDRQAQEVRKIPLTAASRGHASTAKKTYAMQSDEKRDLFKMSKFTRVKAQVDSRRDRVPANPYLRDADNLSQPSWDPRPHHEMPNDWDDQKAGRDPLDADEIDDVGSSAWEVQSSARGGGLREFRCSTPRSTLSQGRSQLATPRSGLGSVRSASARPHY